MFSRSANLGVGVVKQFLFSHVLPYLPTLPTLVATYGR